MGIRHVAAWRKTKQNKLLSAKRKRELALGREAIATDRAVTFLRIVKED